MMQIILHIHPISINLYKNGTITNRFEKESVATTKIDFSKKEEQEIEDELRKLFCLYQKTYRHVRRFQTRLKPLFKNEQI